MMLDTMTRWLEGILDHKRSYALYNIFLPLVDGFSTQRLNSAGLLISSGGATTAKIGATDFYASVTGVLVKIAAGTTMPALTGNTITANSFNVFCFFVDSAGVVTLAAGTQGTTIALVKWPQFPQAKAFVGFLLITHSATFTGGTTPLDTATTVYVNGVGPFNPSVLV